MLASLALAATLAADPYVIFARARSYWLAQRYPASLLYDVAITVDEGGKTKTERYDSAYDALANKVSVNPVSDYEREHPVVPHGVNINLGFSILSKQLNKPLPTDDFLGVPHLAPTYSFGMAPVVSPTTVSSNPYDSPELVQQIRNEFHDPNPHPTATPSSGLPEIAVVSANTHDYQISLLGNDNVDGHECFHLSLKPTRDPGKFRIREAWIDEKNYATWQLKDASNFVRGPGTSVGWTIHFADVAGAHYVAEEDAAAPISSQGLILTTTRIAFEHIAPGSFSFEDLGFSQTMMLEEP